VRENAESVKHQPRVKNNNNNNNAERIKKKEGKRKPPFLSFATRRERIKEPPTKESKRKLPRFFE